MGASLQTWGPESRTETLNYFLIEPIYDDCGPLPVLRHSSTTMTNTTRMKYPFRVKV